MHGSLIPGKLWRSRTYEVAALVYYQISWILKRFPDDEEPDFFGITCSKDRGTT